MTQIHPSAVVSKKARLGADVEIGPLCVIEDDVVIGDQCRLASHVVIKSGTTLGTGNQISEAAVLGGKPQHLRAVDRCGRLRIGDHNVIREHVTIHRGLTAEDCTTLGDGNLLMVNVHVAHDCHIGNQTVMVNNVMLAGHVTVGDRAYFGGAAGVHQFCRIGRLAMIGGQAHISQDVPPFMLVDGISGHIVGLNHVGLRRAGLSQEELATLKAAYRLIYRSELLWKDALAVLENSFPAGPARELHAFLKLGQRGFVQERRVPRAATIRMSDRAVEPATQRRAA